MPSPDESLEVPQRLGGLSDAPVEEVKLRRSQRHDGG
jgi:hypothetical protein